MCYDSQIISEVPVVIGLYLILVGVLVDNVWRTELYFLEFHLPYLLFYSRTYVRCQVWSLKRALKQKQTMICFYYLV